MLRAQAPKSPAAVARVYEFLVGGNCYDVRGLLRKQLMREYGVDPLSEEAENAPSDVSAEDVQKALLISAVSAFFDEDVFH
jgi:hypothetical protein